MRDAKVGGFGGNGGTGGIGGVGGVGNSRKEYTQPKLVTHGSVEKLTQTPGNDRGHDHGSSLPIDWHFGN